jgi:hypothetical protein
MLASSAHVERKLILTGARAGQTCTLAKFNFVDGALVLKGPITAVEKVSLYLGRTYKAFPEGSRELKEAMGDGVRGEVLAPAGAGGELPVPGGAGAGERGAAPVPAADGGAGSDAAPGAAERVPPGDGHAEPGLHGAAGRQRKLAAALAQLDPKNEEHWTQDGHPRLDVIAQLAGLPNLTRAELDTEGCRRPKE